MKSFLRTNRLVIHAVAPKHVLPNEIISKGLEQAKQHGKDGKNSD